MSALTTRDRLAKVLTEHEYDVVTSVGAIIPACKCGWRAESDWASVEVFDEHVADALLASGAVVDAATLADDYELVHHWADAIWDDEPNEAELSLVRLALHTLPAVLAERGDVR